MYAGNEDDFPSVTTFGHVPRDQLRHVKTGGERAFDVPLELLGIKLQKRTAMAIGRITHQDVNSFSRRDTFRHQPLAILTLKGIRPYQWNTSNEFHGNEITTIGKITAIEDCAQHLAVDAEAKALSQEALGIAKGHLQTLEEIAREAMRLAANKLPLQTKFVSRSNTRAVL